MELAINQEDVQRLAVAQALYQIVGAQVKTNAGENLRGRIDAALRGMFDAFGVRSLEMRVGDVAVGTVSVAVSEGPAVSNRAAFEEWALGAGVGRAVRGVDLDRVPDGMLDAVADAVAAICPEAVTEGVELARGWEKTLSQAGQNVVDADGEIVPGLRWARQVRNTTLKGCEPSKVAAALAASGSIETVAQALGAGADAGLIGEAACR